MDGRIASADHSLSFLETIGPRLDHKSEFSEFIAEIDAVILGASTLRWLMAGGHGWPHDDLETWLVTHDKVLVQKVGDTREPLHHVSGSLQGMVNEIRSVGHKNVWLCGGGNLAGQLLGLDAIDDVKVTIAPTVLGSGPALFDFDKLKHRRFKVVEACDGGGDTVRVHWQRDR